MNYGGLLPQKLTNRLLKEEESALEKLTKTLSYLNSFFSDMELDFMFIKLFRNLDYAPRDVDVLLKRGQTSKILSALKKENICVKSSGNIETKCEKEGLLDIDFYEGFYYLSLNFLDEDFLWKTPKTVTFCGVECTIPNPDADFLSLIIHSLLGHRYLSLLDFLYAKSFLIDDWKSEEMIYQTKTH
ncbi:hypothetical protein ACFLRN_10740, partial [Thermoproteota archaeon]